MNVDVTMLSGDKLTVVDSVADQTAISHTYAELLPDDKVEKKNLSSIKCKPLLLSVMVLMMPCHLNQSCWNSDGRIRLSDAAIEVADVVIQDDKPD